MKINQNQTTTSKTDFFYYAFRNILLVGLPLVLVSAFVLSLPHSTATGSGSTSSSDHVYFSLDTSCTMSSELINPHTVDINGGQYKTNVGTTKLNTYCNDGNGYSIYAIGSSNSTDGNTDLINSENNNYNIKTGIYDSSTATPNTPSSWSMKLTSGTGTGNTLTPPTIVNDYDDYSIVPNTYTRVASRSSETEMNPNTDITGSYLTTTYAVYASSIQPAGSYSGNVKYVMIHPHVNNNNIGFNEAFALSGKSSVGSYYAMQDMTSDICNMVNIYDEPSQTQLVDIRDNKLYWVTKLADGHCWMTQNLDFDLNSSTTLNSNTTDLNVAYNSTTGQYAEYNNGYSQVSNIIYWEPASSTINFSGSTMSGWSTNNYVPYSASKTDNTETGHASLGNWYSWTAAIASNNSSNLTTSTYDNVSTNPKNSICPKGWRLPAASSESASIANSTNEYERLSNLYGSTNLTSNPIYLRKAGNIWNGQYANLDTVSHNWTSTTDNNYKAYEFVLFNGSSDNNNLDQNLGFSVRCIAK